MVARAYIFVNLNYNRKHPDFFIVPSKTVAKSCKKGHANWLKTPGKKSQKHKDTSMRMFHDPEKIFETLGFIANVSARQLNRAIINSLKNNMYIMCIIRITNESQKRSGRNI